MLTIEPPCAAREEVLHGRPIGVEQRGEVQVEGLLPAVVGDLVERAVAEPSAAAAGDVEHAVHAPEPLERRVEHTRGEGRVGGIAEDAGRRRAETLGGRRRMRVVASGHRHVRAFAQAREGGRQAHAGRAADDHDRQAIETPGLHARQCGTGIHPRQSLLHYGHAARPSHDRHRQLPVPGVARVRDRTPRGVRRRRSRRDGGRCGRRRGEGSGRRRARCDQRRRADAPRLQPVLLRLPRGTRARGAVATSLRPARARPARQARGRSATSRRRAGSAPWRTSGACNASRRRVSGSRRACPARTR